MKKKNLSKNNKGFTLIEILVGMLIFGILMLTISTIMYPTLKSIYNTKRLSEYGVFVDNIANQVSSEIKLAQKIELEPSDKPEKLIIYTPENKIRYTILDGILKVNYNDEKNSESEFVYYDVLSEKYYDDGTLQILYKPIYRDSNIVGCKLAISIIQAEEKVFEKEYSMISFI